MLRQPLLLAALGLVLVGNDCKAQRPRGVFFRSSNSFSRLLRDDELRKDLQFTERQGELLDALLGDLFNQVVASRRRPEGESESSRSPQAFARKSDQLISVVLDRRQLRRLREIRLQIEGVRALDRAEVIRKLGLSEAQREEIRKLRSGFQRFEATTAQEAAVLDVLTEEQRQQWDEMQGDVYDGVERLRRRSRFGRGGRGRQRGEQRPRRPSPDR